MERPHESDNSSYIEKANASHYSNHQQSPANGDVSRVQYTGDNNEYIIINRQKYRRDELQAAFAGTLNPGLAPYPKININAAPLGLCAFALTNFMISLYNAQAMGITIPNVVVGMGCLYGGVIQVLSGFYCFISGNTFALTALASYGTFWISYAVIYVPNFGIGSAYATAEDLNQAVGLFIIGWIIFTFIILMLTLKSTVAFMGIFFFLLIEFTLLAAGLLAGKTGVVRAGGCVGMITSVFAWYDAFAGTATPFNSYITARPIPLPWYRQGAQS